MGAGFRATSSVNELQQELVAAHGQIQELMAAFEGMTEVVRTQQQQHALRIEELVREKDELLTRLEEFQARAESASTSAEPPPAATVEPAPSHLGEMLAEEARARDSEIQAMMDMIHTPPSTGPTQSQLDDALGRADELQERLSQVEQEHDDWFRELETRVAASELETARARLEADSMRRLSARCSQQVQELEAWMAQAEASAAVALLGAVLFDPAPVPVAAASVSGHSRALIAEQIERARSSLHLEMLRSALRGSRERSRTQSQAASSVAQPTPRLPDGGREGSGEFGH